MISTPAQLHHSPALEPPRRRARDVLTVCGGATIAALAALGYSTLSSTVLTILAPVFAGAGLGALFVRVLRQRDRSRTAARHDRLTGGLSRTAFETELAREIERARRYQQTLGMLMIDIDHFKRINDTHGHPAGDDALAQLGRVIRSVVRTSDRLGRWGGDELALFAPSTGLRGARAVAEKIRAAVATHRFGFPESVTVSIGVAQFVAGDDVRSLTARADQALYQAKREGRNCTAVMRCLRPTLPRSVTSSRS